MLLDQRFTQSLTASENAPHARLSPRRLQPIGDGSSSSTPGAAGWWAGPSPTICAPSWSSTPSRWPPSVAGHLLARPSPTPTTDRAIRQLGLRSPAAGQELLRDTATRAAGRAPLARSRPAGRAIFEGIEAWYSPHRRHTSIGTISPIEFERVDADPPKPRREHMAALAGFWLDEAPAKG